MAQIHTLSTLLACAEYSSLHLQYASQVIESHQERSGGGEAADKGGDAVGVQIAPCWLLLNMAAYEGCHLCHVCIAAT